MKLRTIGAVSGISLLLSFDVLAAPPTKEECVEAHGRAQEARDKGQMTDAKRYALVCAQSTCPALVQSDCSRFSDEFSRTVPSLVFGARDGRGVDLLDTQVYLDGVLVSPRIDGTPHDLDPGRHTVRFVHAGKESTQTLMVNPGEHSRPVVAVFDEGAVAGPAGPSGGESPTASKPSRPVFPLIVAGAGVVAAGVGTVLFLNGLSRVPANCSRSGHTCDVPQGDPALDSASSALGQANLGLGIGIAGLVVAAGGLIWYFTSSPSEPEKATAPVAVTPGGAGFHF